MQTATVWVRRIQQQANVKHESAEKLAASAFAWANYYGPTFGTVTYAECLAAAKAVIEREAK